MSTMFKKQEASQRIHGINISKGGQKISHLLFPDDCFLFSKANPSENRILKDILTDFSNASGQVINYKKSSISFSINMYEDLKKS